MEANEPKKEQNTEEMDVMKQFIPNFYNSSKGNGVSIL